MSETAALQAALAAEQAIVFGYGVVGAHLKGADRGLAASQLSAHQRVRDQLAALIAAAGAVPTAAQPAYRLPFAVEDIASAKQLAVHLESGAAGAAWDLIAATAPGSDNRSLAVDWLSDAAVSATQWGAPAAALPGRPH